MFAIGLSMEITTMFIIKKINDVNNPALMARNFMGLLIGTVLFWLGIGIMIYGVIKVVRKRHEIVSGYDVVIKKEPVSIKRQTIYAIIPILDLYAAYKIEKFRLYFVIMLGISLGVEFALRTVLLFIPFPYSTIISEAVYIPIAVYLIRRWSTKWNGEIDRQNSQPSTDFEQKKD